MPFLAKMAKEHRGEARITPRREYGEAVASGPEQHPGEPLLEAKANSGGQRAVDDGEHARCAAQENGTSERAVDRHLKSLHMLAIAGHAISAPPPKLKKLRKKLEAAKAIDRPKTI
ncbi:hypothetical protein GCM10019071_35140 [Sphingobium fuliginis]|uniref:Uncharacterized protein n=1 Tax=Sphingobium fuliginis (strain ATCC 27551) TaxID=336203 RepID=A0ABQ1F6Z5_SPHSA|nr:hypothetical protein GCM10019071_35140 [Sphingobium fuliginis]